MKIKIFKNLNEFDEFEFKLTSLKELYSGLVLNKDIEYATKVVEGKYKYVLLPEKEEDKPVALSPEVCIADLIGFKEILVIPDIEGEIAAAALIPLMYGAAATAATITAGQLVLAYVVAAVVNIAISMALNMVMSLLSPTKEFSSDPAQAQQYSSSLFNGAPLIKEQGGGVPLAYGYGFAGGVLISSSISTSDY